MHAPVFAELHANDDKFRVIVFGFLTVMFAIQIGASALAWLSMTVTDVDTALQATRGSCVTNGNRPATLSVIETRHQ